MQGVVNSKTGRTDCPLLRLLLFTFWLPELKFKLRPLDADEAPDAQKLPSPPTFTTAPLGGITPIPHERG